MSIIDNPYRKYKVAPKVVLTPSQWRTYNHVRTLGSFAKADQKAAFQLLIDEGLLVESSVPRRQPISKKKPGVGVRKRPDIIYTDNKIASRPYSITYALGNGKTVVSASKSESMTEWVFDRKAVTLVPVFDTKHITGKLPFIWLRPQPYVRCIKKKSIVSATYTTSPNVVSYDVHKGSMVSVLTGAFWNSTSVPESIKNEALLKFHGKLADGKVDLMTFAAEAKSSLSMITEAASDLLTIYKSIRRGNMRQANRVLRSRNMPKPKRVSKRPDERWLQYQYGWAPLVGDITTAMEAIASGAETPHLFAVGGGIKYMPSPYNSSVETVSSMGEYKVKCYYALGPNPKARTMAQWNLTSNPFLTAWELVPYSFVVDWFVPIGDFLTQYSSTDGLVFISGTESTSVTYTATLKSKVRFSGTNCWVDCERLIKEETFFYDRRVLSRTPFASYPPFSASASFRRFFSALSLLTVRLKSK